MDLLEQAQRSLNKALASMTVEKSIAHSLDSIASSLLYTAENIKNKPPANLYEVELVVRRVMDNLKTPTVKNPKGNKQ